MRVYVLRVTAGESPQDEWYPSLKAARERRAELVQLGPLVILHDRPLERCGGLRIEAVDLIRLAPRTGALALLNRHNGLGEPWVKATTVVPEPRW